MEAEDLYILEVLIIKRYSQQCYNRSLYFKLGKILNIGAIVIMDGNGTDLLEASCNPLTRSCILLLPHKCI